MWTHGEEVGAAFGLLPDGRGRVGGLRHVDAQLLLTGTRRGRHRRRVVAQAATAVTRLDGRRNENINNLLTNSEQDPSQQMSVMSKWRCTYLKGE